MISDSPIRPPRIYSPVPLTQAERDALLADATRRGAHAARLERVECGGEPLRLLYLARGRDGSLEPFVTLLRLPAYLQPAAARAAAPK